MCLQRVVRTRARFIQLVAAIQLRTVLVLFPPDSTECRRGSRARAARAAANPEREGGAGAAGRGEAQSEPGAVAQRAQGEETGMFAHSFSRVSPVFPLPIPLSCKYLEKVGLRLKPSCVHTPPIHRAAEMFRFSLACALPHRRESLPSNSYCAHTLHDIEWLTRSFSLTLARAPAQVLQKQRALRQRRKAELQDRRSAASKQRMRLIMQQANDDEAVCGAYVCIRTWGAARESRGFRGSMSCIIASGRCPNVPPLGQVRMHLGNGSNLYTDS